MRYCRYVKHMYYLTHNKGGSRKPRIKNRQRKKKETQQWTRNKKQLRTDKQKKRATCGLYLKLGMWTRYTTKVEEYKDSPHLDCDVISSIYTSTLQVLSSYPTQSCCSSLEYRCSSLSCLSDSLPHKDRSQSGLPTQCSWVRCCNCHFNFLNNIH